jgi:hypothetical protein
MKLLQKVENRQTAICFAGLSTYNNMLNTMYDLLRNAEYFEQKYILSAAMSIILELRNKEIRNESKMEKQRV